MSGFSFISAIICSLFIIFLYGLISPVHDVSQDKFKSSALTVDVSSPVYHSNWAEQYTNLIWKHVLLVFLISIWIIWLFNDAKKSY